MATKKDFTQVAHAVFMQATGAAPVQTPTPKQLAGRKGGLKGGKTRMSSLTEEQRTALALKGVAARKKTPAVEAGAKITK
jgi:hypothetical protein